MFPDNTEPKLGCLGVMRQYLQLFWDSSYKLAVGRPVFMFSLFLSDMSEFIGSWSVELPRLQNPIFYVM